MTVAPGTRIGPYEIAARIGQGGMGEVYSATDTNLRRSVAIKVLPESVAADADRLARFQREAEVLAALNHPNIAAIYGLERAGGHTALIMELVEGPTLDQRIEEHRAAGLPVEDALAIAKQIAEALEAAHERGIVHRDLKPANVKVRADGTVKVLDFGLAKIAEAGEAGKAGGARLRGDAASAGQVGRENLSQTPTLTTPALMTGVGMILGTAAYMSPEQAKGQTVDRRSDVWAFGCVLYEMLTGRRVFEAETVTEALAAVLRAEPDWSRLPAGLSPSLRVFLVRCLQKDPRQRVHHIADVRLALEGAFDVGVAQAQRPAVPQPRWRRVLPAVAAATLAALVTGLAMWTLGRRVATPKVARLQMALPQDQAFYYSGRHLIAISPDGTLVAYTAGLGLWLHPIDQLEAKQVPGAEVEGRSPFFSSDGQSIGYYAAGELRRVSVTGGAPVTITKAINPWGASWGDDDIVYYGQGTGGIWRVPAAGGTAEQAITMKAGEQAHGPHLLPDREWVLFTLLPTGIGSWNRAQIVVQSLTTGERVLLIDGGRDARYLSTGHLVYSLNGTILAVPFDAGARRLTGGAVPLVKDVYDAGTVTGAAHFDVATTGSLVYVPRPASALLRLTWVDRNGREEAIPADPRPYSHARVSPDGERIVAEVNDATSADIWVGDVRSGSFTRLTRGEDVESDPIWTPDGSRVVYSAVRGAEGLFLQPADGSGAPVHLTDVSGGVRAMTWTKDGRLLYDELAGPQVRLVTPDGRSSSEGISLFDAPEYFNEKLPNMSPDGRWVAYQSSESGDMEVYIRPFPDVSSQRRQVSVGGGLAPLWSANGREIYYRTTTDMMAAKVETTPRLAVGTPQALFGLSDYVLPGTRGIKYDVAPDGRFLMLKDQGNRGPQSRVVLVLNWFEDLKRLVPVN